MNTPDMLASLNLMTLVSVAVALLVLYLLFMRKKSNRHPLAGKEDDHIGERLDAMNKKVDEAKVHDNKQM